MTSSKRVCVFAIACLTAVSGFSISQTHQSRGGRKLFGGYRIVPKVCQPTNPSRIKSNEPSICMFNYECGRRNGEVVGACMDGFLFGACCQLPPKNAQISMTQTNFNSPIDDPMIDLHEIDHVPDLPILLNPDGTPVGMSPADITGTTKYNVHATSNNLAISSPGYTKLSTLSPDRTTENLSLQQNIDLSHLEANFPVLLGQQDILDDLRLPGLITHSDNNNDIQEHQDHSPINPVTTLLSPDQILQIADPVDQLPALFAQGLGQNNHTGAETVLLNLNGTRLHEKNNPDELFKPERTTKQPSKNETPFDRSTTLKLQRTSQTPSSTVRYSNYEEKHATPTLQQYSNRITVSGSNLKTTVTRIPIRTSSLVSQPNKDSSDSMTNNILTTTPMSTTDDDDDLVRVPTITYDVQSGNKKNDELNREEISINHIISLLNATTPSGPTRLTQHLGNGGSSTHTWVSIDETSRPSHSRLPVTKPSTPMTETPFPYTFYKPGRPTTYYHYDTASTKYTGSSSYSGSSSSATSVPHTSQKVTSSYGNNYGYTKRPTINPPAPTVIVLGPLGTEYTTLTTQKPSSRKPTTVTIRPSLVTKSPSVATTITHNISTVISTNSASTSNNHVVSTSYISVNLKDHTSPKPIDTSIINEAVESETHPETPITKRPSTIWTTLSSWSGKPSFHLKPQSQSDIKFPTAPTQEPVHVVFFKETTTRKSITPSTITMSTVTQATTTYDDETPAPDDLINFPPVRNPNLTQQEKPTIVQNDTDYLDINQFNDNDIPTPSFVEDDVLTNKVDVFVHNIVESLQDNFNDLKDVVYAKKNATTPSPALQTNNVTKKPIKRKPIIKSSTPKPSSATSKRPVTKKPTRPTGVITQKPANKPNVRPTKPVTTKPKPTGIAISTTKKPISTVTKRKPIRRPASSTTTTTIATTSEVIAEDTEASVVEADDVSEEVEGTTANYREECGVRPLIKSGRIVGGKGATFGEWPWQVLVRESTWLGLFTKNKCGGVLVTKNFVITAAHCQPGFLATLVAVFGEFDISGELESKRSITRNVRRVIVNRNYNALTFENDLALLELEKSVTYDAHIVPICMPDDGADFTGRMATVTGWGRVKYNGGTPSVLQEVQVPIMENAVCQDMFLTAGHTKLILDSFLCAGYANGQKDSCEGDSGGPLMMEGPDGRWILVGTVSHGIKCAAPYLPGVYMRTTFFKPWIHSVTGA